MNDTGNRKENRFYNSSINKRIRHLMDTRKTKTEDLAKATSVSNTSIRMWYTGQSRPDLDKIPIICDFFKVSANYLLGIDEAENFEANSVCQATGISPNAAEVLCEMNQHKNNNPDSRIAKTISEKIHVLSFIIEHGFLEEYIYSEEKEPHNGSFLGNLYNYLLISHKLPKVGEDKPQRLKTYKYLGDDFQGEDYISVNSLHHMYLGGVITELTKLRDVAANSKLISDAVDLLKKLDQGGIV